MDKVNFLKKSVTPFLGQSDYAKEICKLIGTISENKSNVLLFGERGTGKRLFAENVHFCKCGSLKNFFVLNCRFERDVFLQKLNKVQNDLQLPDGDFKSVYFENIDKLNLETQNDVLLFLKKLKEFDSSTQIRVFCSTESFLENKVSQGLFNNDLFYYLSSIVLNFLPLRSRKEDIVTIANYYKSYFEKKSGIVFDSFSDSVIEVLKNYFWNGNVDELINTIQHAFIVANKSYITKKDLGIDSSFASADIVDSSDVELQDKSLKTAIDAFKKDYVTKILEENGWNQTKTAKILGIQRTYVIRLINELQIMRK